MVQFQFLHDVYLTVNKERNELGHNLKPTQFAIYNYCMASKGSELVLCYALSVLML